MDKAHTAINGSPPHYFSLDDVFTKGSVVGWLNGLLSIQSWRHFITLAGILTFPLLLMIIATIYEGRFLLGSVYADIDGVGRIIGMSFSGDTMVWPFIIIVPIAFILLRMAVKRSIRLLDAVALNCKQRWVYSRADDDLMNIVNETKNEFRRNNGTVGTVLRIAPWILASAFWFYNTTTCMFHPYLPESCYPYTSKFVYVHSGPAVPMPDEYIASSPIQVPKWDTNLKAAPLSCISARIFALIYYGSLPFILAALSGLIIGVVDFLAKISAFQRSMSPTDSASVLDELKPFSVDGFGGLGSLAETGMGYIYVLSCFIMLISLSYFKESTPPSAHNAVLVFLFIPVAIAVFIAPSVAIRSALVRSKRMYLHALGTQLNEISSNICSRSHVENASQPSESAIEQYHRLQSLKLLYDHVMSVPEWPFSSRAIVRISFSVGLPLILILLDKVITYIFTAS